MYAGPYAAGKRERAEVVLAAAATPQDEWRQGLTDDARRVVCFHSTQETTVYSVEDDVAGIICEALSGGC